MSEPRPIYTIPPPPKWWYLCAMHMLPSYYEWRWNTVLQTAQTPPKMHTVVKLYSLVLNKVLVCIQNRGTYSQPNRGRTSRTAVRIVMSTIYSKVSQYRSCTTKSVATSSKALAAQRNSTADPQSARDKAKQICSPRKDSQRHKEVRKLIFASHPPHPTTSWMAGDAGDATIDLDTYERGIHQRERKRFRARADRARVEYPSRSRNAHACILMHTVAWGEQKSKKKEEE